MEGQMLISDLSHFKWRETDILSSTFPGYSPL